MNIEKLLSALQSAYETSKRIERTTEYQAGFDNAIEYLMAAYEERQAHFKDSIESEADYKAALNSTMRKLQSLEQDFCSLKNQYDLAVTELASMCPGPRSVCLKTADGHLCYFRGTYPYPMELRFPIKEKDPHYMVRKGYHKSSLKERRYFLTGLCTQVGHPVYEEFIGVQRSNSKDD